MSTPDKEIVAETTAPAEHETQKKSEKQLKKVKNVGNSMIWVYLTIVEAVVLLCYLVYVDQRPENYTAHLHMLHGVIPPSLCDKIIVEIERFAKAQEDLKSIRRTLPQQQEDEEGEEDEKNIYLQRGWYVNRYAQPRFPMAPHGHLPLSLHLFITF